MDTNKTQIDDKYIADYIPEQYIDPAIAIESKSTNNNHIVKLEEDSEDGDIVRKKSMQANLIRKSSKKFTSLTSPGTQSSTTVSMVGCILSAGAVTMPYVFRKVGVIPALILMVLGWQLTLYTSQMLVKCVKQGQFYSQEAIAHQIFGKKATVATTVMMFLLCLGWQVAALVMASTLTTEIMVGLFGVPIDSFFGNEASQRFQAAIMQFGFVLPVSLMKRLKDMLPATVSQIVIIIQVIGSIVACSLVYEGRQRLNEFSPDFEIFKIQKGIDMNLAERFHRMNMYSTDIKDQLESFPFVIFVFAGQPLVLSLQEGMNDKNQDRANRILVNSTLFTLQTLVMFGFFGYMLFLDITCSNILLNDFKNYSFAGAGSQVIILSVLFNMPFNIIPMRNAMISWIVPDEADIDRIPQKLILVCAIVSNIICQLCSIITSDVGDVVTIVGNTLTVFMCQMLPCIFIACMRSKEEGISLLDGKNLTAWVTCVLCFIAGCVSMTFFTMDKMGVI